MGMGMGAEFGAGGFGAQYGGRTSSILDVTARNGNKQNLAGSVSVAVTGGGGAFSGAGSGAEGFNTIKNTVRAYVENGSTITSMNSGAVTIEAKDTSRITAYGIAGTVSISGSAQSTFERMCAALGVPELVDDPRFATKKDRVANNDELSAILAGYFKTNTNDHWFKLIDAEGNRLEIFQFNSIVIGDEVDPAALQPSDDRKQAKVSNFTLDSQPSVPVSENSRWQAGWLPEGFTLSSVHARRTMGEDKLVNTMMFSDGLAAFSVFIEDMPPAGAADMVSRNGATVAVTHLTKGPSAEAHLITLVGELPTGTAERSAQSIRYQ